MTILRAELMKVRILPTPMVIAAACFVISTIVAVVVLATTPAEDDVYRDAPVFAAFVPGMIGALVFGAWVFGLDFAQGTMRRTVTTEPRRPVIVAAKFLVVTVVTGAFLAAYGALSALVAIAISSSNSIDIVTGEAFELVPSLALQGTLVALLAGAITLLVRSFTGGLIATFAMVFVIDELLGISETIRDYTFGVALRSVDAAFATSDPGFAGTHSLAGGILLGLGWVAAIAIPGAIRFTRDDLK
ncbi:MAG: hypothetical protein WAP35_02780 [Solirubrobacterales bacterium]